MWNTVLAVINYQANFLQEEVESGFLYDIFQFWNVGLKIISNSVIGQIDFSNSVPNKYIITY